MAQFGANKVPTPWATNPNMIQRSGQQPVMSQNVAALNPAATMIVQQPNQMAFGLQFQQPTLQLSQQMTPGVSLGAPGIALPTTLSSAQSMIGTGQVSYPTPGTGQRAINPPVLPVAVQSVQQQQQQQQMKQRVFTGTITKLHDNFGFVDEDVFFQTNCVKGSVPRVGDRVLVEAQYNPSMPFKWNATRIQLLPSQSGGGGGGSGGGRSQASLTRGPPSRSNNSGGGGKQDYGAVPPPTSTQNNAGDGGSLVTRLPHSGRPRSPARRYANERRPIREEPEGRKRSRSPRRRGRTAVRYTVHVPKLVLNLSQAGVMDIKKRYGNLYVPSDFIQSRFLQSETFPLDRPFQVATRVTYHVFDKEVDPPEQKEAVFEPADADYRFCAKVMLLSTPSWESMCRKTASLTEEDVDDDDLVHPSRVINFLVGLRGKNETMAIGGPWSPSEDGVDPDSDPQVLIRTAVRTCRALTGIDLANCTKWYRLAEVFYRRGEKTTETVVLFLPDPGALLPSRVDWEKQQLFYRRQLQAKLSPGGPATGSDDKDDETDGDVSLNQTPSHWDGLDPKNMKVSELRHELELRTLSPKGLKSQLIARLTKVIKTEEDDEAAGVKRDAVTKAASPPTTPSRTAAAAAEEDSTALDEVQQRALQKKYTLSSDPAVVVHPHRKAKSGKFDCAVMSLSVLLDYRPEDNKEHSFEVSLFAEIFNEMLMRDAGFNIYRALVEAPEKKEEKPKSKDGSSDKKDDKDSEDAASQANMYTADRGLLVSFSYFDTAHCNFIIDKDLEEILMTIGLNISRAQARKLVQKVAVKDGSVHYRKLTDRPVPESGEPEMMDDLKKTSASLLVKNNQKQLPEFAAHALLGGSSTPAAGTGSAEPGELTTSSRADVLVSPSVRVAVEAAVRDYLAHLLGVPRQVTAATLSDSPLAAEARQQLAAAVAVDRKPVVVHRPPASRLSPEARRRHVVNGTAQRSSTATISQSRSPSPSRATSKSSAAAQVSRSQLKSILKKTGHSEAASAGDSKPAPPITGPLRGILKPAKSLAEEKAAASDPPAKSQSSVKGGVVKQEETKPKSVMEALKAWQSAAPATVTDALNSWLASHKVGDVDIADGSKPLVLHGQGSEDNPLMVPDSPPHPSTALPDVKVAPRAHEPYDPFQATADDDDVIEVPAPTKRSRTTTRWENGDGDAKRPKGPDGDQGDGAVQDMEVVSEESGVGENLWASVDSWTSLDATHDTSASADVRSATVKLADLLGLQLMIVSNVQLKPVERGVRVLQLPPAGISLSSLQKRLCDAIGREKRRCLSVVFLDLRVKSMPWLADSAGVSALFSSVRLMAGGDSELLMYVAPRSQLRDDVARALCAAHAGSKHPLTMFVNEILNKIERFDQPLGRLVHLLRIWLLYESGRQKKFVPIQIVKSMRTEWETQEKLAGTCCHQLFWLVETASTMDSMRQLSKQHQTVMSTPVKAAHETVAVAAVNTGVVSETTTAVVNPWFMSDQWDISGSDADHDALPCTVDPLEELSYLTDYQVLVLCSGSMAERLKRFYDFRARVSFVTSSYQNAEITSLADSIQQLLTADRGTCLMVVLHDLVYDEAAGDGSDILAQCERLRLLHSTVEAHAAGSRLVMRVRADLCSSDSLRRVELRRQAALAGCPANQPVLRYLINLVNGAELERRSLDLLVPAISSWLLWEAGRQNKVVPLGTLLAFEERFGTPLVAPEQLGLSVALATRDIQYQMSVGALSEERTSVLLDQLWPQRDSLMVASAADMASCQALYPESPDDNLNYLGEEIDRLASACGLRVLVVADDTCSEVRHLAELRRRLSVVHLGRPSLLQIVDMVESSLRDIRGPCLVVVATLLWDLAAGCDHLMMRQYLNSVLQSLERTVADHNMHTDMIVLTDLQHAKYSPQTPVPAEMRETLTLQNRRSAVGNLLDVAAAIMLASHQPPVTLLMRCIHLFVQELARQKLPSARRISAASMASAAVSSRSRSKSPGRHPPKNTCHTDPLAELLKLISFDVTVVVDSLFDDRSLKKELGAGVNVKPMQSMSVRNMKMVLRGLLTKHKPSSSSKQRHLVVIGTRLADAERVSGGSLQATCKELCQLYKMANEAGWVLAITTPPIDSGSFDGKYRDPAAARSIRNVAKRCNNTARNSVTGSVLGVLSVDGGYSSLPISMRMAHFIRSWCVSQAVRRNIPVSLAVIDGLVAQVRRSQPRGTVTVHWSIFMMARKQAMEIRATSQTADKTADEKKCDAADVAKNTNASKTEDEKTDKPFMKTPVEKVGDAGNASEEEEELKFETEVLSDDVDSAENETTGGDLVALCIQKAPKLSMPVVLLRRLSENTLAKLSGGKSSTTTSQLQRITEAVNESGAAGAAEDGEEDVDDLICVEAEDSDGGDCPEAAPATRKTTDPGSWEVLDAC